MSFDRMEPRDDDRYSQGGILEQFCRQDIASKSVLDIGNDSNGCLKNQRRELLDRHSQIEFHAVCKVQFLSQTSEASYVFAIANNEKFDIRDMLPDACDRSKRNIQSCSLWNRAVIDQPEAFRLRAKGVSYEDSVIRHVEEHA